MVASRPGVVVGLRAEARLLRGLGWPVAIGGGHAAGAARAAQVLAEAGVTALVSFGLAGGLDPALPPGTVLIPRAVQLDGRALPVDPDLARALGGPTEGLLLCGTEIAATAGAKARLRRETGCVALDLETGGLAAAAAARNLPFAVLRVVCDPAETDLPPAALAALDRAGRIGLHRVLGSVAANPRQLPALLALARQAEAARRALSRHLMRQVRAWVPADPVAAPI